MGFYASNVGFSTRSCGILTPLSLALGVAVPRIIHWVLTMEYTYTPKGKNRQPSRDQAWRSVLLRQSANERLAEVHVFVVELHVGRKWLRDENLSLCQKDVNTPHKENE